MTEGELRALAEWLRRMALNPGDRYDKASAALSSLSKEKAELERQLAACQEELASYKPTPEDIAEGEARAESEEWARDRAERYALDHAYDEGYRAGHASRQPASEKKDT